MWPPSERGGQHLEGCECEVCRESRRRRAPPAATEPVPVRAKLTSQQPASAQPAELSREEMAELLEQMEDEPSPWSRRSQAIVQAVLAEAPQSEAERAVVDMLRSACSLSTPEEALLQMQRWMRMFEERAMRLMVLQR